MTETFTPDFKTGDVYRYTPENRHAREGLAIVLDGATQYIVDTFWHSDRTRLTRKEIDTVHEFVFNIHDPQWEKVAINPATQGPAENLDHYLPEDIRVITSQHGLRTAYYKRVGAAPNSDRIEASLKDAIENAESQLRSAQNKLKWAIDDYEKETGRAYISVEN